MFLCNDVIIRNYTFIDCWGIVFHKYNYVVIMIFYEDENNILIMIIITNVNIINKKNKNIITNVNENLIVIRVYISIIISKRY